MRLKKENKSYPILGVKAGMNDAIHVEVEVIVFDVVRVLLARIDRDLNAVDDDWFLFDRVHNHHRILLGQPPVEGWDSHLCVANSDSICRKRKSLIQFTSLSNLNAEEEEYAKQVNTDSSTALARVGILQGTERNEMSILPFTKFASAMEVQYLTAAFLSF